MHVATYHVHGLEAQVQGDASRQPIVHSRADDKVVCVLEFLTQLGCSSNGLCLSVGMVNTIAIGKVVSISEAVAVDMVVDMTVAIGIAVGVTVDVDSHFV